LPDDRMVVAVAGGSLGARRINDAVAGLAREWGARQDLCIYHVAGRRDYAALAAARPELPSDGLDYRLVEFEDRLPLLLSAADVAVQRAGASTVAELAVIGVPAVMVPLPGAPGDHQTVNARRLADAGAAVVVPDAELDAGRLAAELQPLLAEPSRRERMAAAARAIGRPGAAGEVASLIESVAKDRAA
jgi:UDP-N-acetylglucosamine--N-acetylmuramyl-(pentapeptide) pyrophosphoryl-undecaprenol N-acetylglucosamine transferase